MTKKIPYVRASFRTHPNLSISRRAALVGLPKKVLRGMIKDDFTVEEIERLKKEGQSKEKEK
ncbi:unnamed protein product [Acanthoscelides obtectus]|uniref:Uncharacterized protein n=1 Tax=Acanthoscelides obtectus TaxID=200917 RepID=A0A9P0KU42_ACAOB|nr:unnamed protein product [Acanthoscelides obtectus]CAK1669235.1 hypothetical protein AOBTE_LOCUS26888 [Acanthoscelides obtectus]